jgi:biopolymer transport protein TolQ
VEVELRTFGTFFLALATQGSASGTPPDSSLDIIQLVINASWQVQLVMLTLMFFSATSWGIVIYKYLQYRRAAEQTATFLGVFRKSNKFSEVHAVCANLGASPLVGLFLAGYAELNAQLRGPGGDAAKPPAAPARPTLRSLEAVDRALLRASTTEVSKLEHRMSFLATTASISPYIGLFGTVWGIMTAFQMIAGAGSTSLSVVAPGIAEALVTTAMGLFAAIPAVYFYNDLTGRVKSFVSAMEDFSMEFLGISERNFT